MHRTGSYRCSPAIFESFQKCLRRAPRAREVYLSRPRSILAEAIGTALRAQASANTVNHCRSFPSASVCMLRTSRDELTRLRSSCFRRCRKRLTVLHLQGELLALFTYPASLRQYLEFISPLTSRCTSSIHQSESICNALRFTAGVIETNSFHLRYETFPQPLYIRYRAVYEESEKAKTFASCVPLHFETRQDMDCLSITRGTFAL